MSWQISLEKKFSGKRIYPECRVLFDEISKRLPKSAIIVDCGCGRGGLLSLFKEHDYVHVVGYDLSPNRVIVARSFDLNVFEWDVRLLPLWDDAVDCVLYEESLEYLEEAAYLSTLREATRVLKKHGLLIIASLTFGGPEPEPRTYYERSLCKADLMRLLPNFAFVDEKYVMRGKHSCFVLILQKVN